MLAGFFRGRSAEKRKLRQSGQALIYGLFILIAGMAALFFLFNASQLTREKTKLVNTSDAVAYSAGVMHARAMNFASYTNRALVADEVAIAQAVSLASWGEYLLEHGQSAIGLGCDPQQSYGIFAEPVAQGMLVYAPVCESLGYGYRYNVLSQANTAVQKIGHGVVVASEISKAVLKASQTVMMSSIAIARRAVMQDVADANYAQDGGIKVDEIPLRDTFHAYNGRPMLRYRQGDERGRMRDLAMQVANKDRFVSARNWGDTALIPEPSCLILGLHHNYVTRTGSTRLIGFDEWRAQDQATYHRKWLRVRRFSLPSCRTSGQTLGSGSKSVRDGQAASLSGDVWKYSGIPSYAELSEDALRDPDPRAKFVIRVMRETSETGTSDARSEIHTTPRLNAYHSAAPIDQLARKRVYVGVSASETFFQRPEQRGDGNKELASLFNPYWQTHLMEVPADVRTAAQALQGAVAP